MAETRILLLVAEDTSTFTSNKAMSSSLPSSSSWLGAAVKPSIVTGGCASENTTNTSSNDDKSCHSANDNNKSLKDDLVLGDADRSSKEQRVPDGEEQEPQDSSWNDNGNNNNDTNDDEFLFWIFRLLYMNGYLFHEVDEWIHPKAIVLTMGTMLAYVHAPWKALEDVIFLIFLGIQLYWYYQSFPSLANHSNLHVIKTMVLLPHQVQRCYRHAVAFFLENDEDEEAVAADDEPQRSEWWFLLRAGRRPRRTTTTRCHKNQEQEDDTTKNHAVVSKQHQRLRSPSESTSSSSCDEKNSRESFGSSSSSSENQENENSSTTTSSTAAEDIMIPPSSDKNKNKNNNKDCSMISATTTTTTAKTNKKNNMALTDNDALSSLRCIIVILYFFAGFHKLNADFFDLEVTCAFDVILPIVEPLLDTDPRNVLPLFLQQALPALVIAMELLPAFLFLFPKWQKHGILLLLLIHGPLSFAGFADFSSIGMANLFLFVSPSVFRQESFWKPYFGAMTVLFVVCHMYFGVDKNEQEEFDFTFHEGLLLVTAYVPVWYHYFRTNVPGPTFRLPKSWWNRFVPALFIFFCMNNYLGLRTAGTVSMFSNLRTEGPRSNHFLLGSNPLKWFDYQDDWVYIVDADPRVSGDYRYQLNADVIVPWIQFCRLVEDVVYDEHRDLYLLVEYHGVEYETHDLSFDTNFTSQFQIPWWQSFFFEFREIYEVEEKQSCTW